tara:strand:- start:8463 stop:9386 length:924 start_codon:yes stop_codon:yes gene_type:complete
MKKTSHVDDTIDSSLLRVLLVLGDTRSVSAASKVLKVSQPAVSYSLKKLRDYFRDPLFIASKEGLIPTDKASVLMPELQHLLDELSQVVRSAKVFDALTSSKRFRIGMLDITEYWLLPKLLAAIRFEAPGILVEGVSLPEPSDIPSLLSSGELDVVITDREITEKIIRCEIVSSENIKTLVNNSFDSDNQTLTLEQFLEIPHIVFQKRNPGVDDALKAIGRVRKIYAVAQSFGTMLCIASKGGFICSLPEKCARESAKVYGLKLLTPPLDIEPWQLYLGWHTRFNADPTLKWLVHQIKKVINEESFV